MSGWRLISSYSAAVQGSLLAQYAMADADLPEIVEKCRVLDPLDHRGWHSHGTRNQHRVLRHTQRVTLCVHVLRLECRDHRADSVRVRLTQQNRLLIGLTRHEKWHHEEGETRKPNRVEYLRDCHPDEASSQLRRQHPRECALPHSPERFSVERAYREPDQTKVHERTDGRRERERQNHAWGEDRMEREEGGAEDANVEKSRDCRRQSTLAEIEGHLRRLTIAGREKRSGMTEATPATTAAEGPA